MLSNNMIRNISSNYERLGKLQEQITSQKKFSKPSDNPVAAMMGMNYRTDLNQVQQFSRNIAEATNWINTTDSALNESVSALQRIRELTVQASNGTYDSQQRQSIVAEIEQLKQHLMNVGDTQLGGKYIFNGYNTDTRPSVAGVYDNHEIQIEVFNGIQIPINTSGKSLYENLLKTNGTIDTLKTVLTDPTQSNNITNQLDTIDQSIDQFLKVQATVGAKQNRIDLMTNRLSQQEVFAQDILSKNEDVDMEKTVLEFTTQQSVHTASLSVGSKIIQPSLIDFLR